MERLCARRNRDCHGHSWRGSACGKPIPFEAGRAFGPCAFDSRPLRQRGCVGATGLPCRAVNPELFGAIEGSNPSTPTNHHTSPDRNTMQSKPSRDAECGRSLTGESSRLSIEQMPVRFRSAAPEDLSRRRLTARPAPLQGADAGSIPAGVTKVRTTASKFAVDIWE